MYLFDERLFQQALIYTAFTINTLYCMDDNDVALKKIVFFLILFRNISESITSSILYSKCAFSRSGAFPFFLGLTWMLRK